MVFIMILYCLLVIMNILLSVCNENAVTYIKCLVTIRFMSYYSIKILKSIIYINIISIISYNMIRLGCSPYCCYFYVAWLINYKCGSQGNTNECLSVGCSSFVLNKALQIVMMSPSSIMGFFYCWCRRVREWFCFCLHAA